jgi:hypothetical protein
MDNIIAWNNKKIRYVGDVLEPNVAMVKDLLVDNVDGHVLYFCDEATRIAKPDIKDKN